MAFVLVILLALATVGAPDFAEQKRLEAIICESAAAPAWCEEAAP